MEPIVVTALVSIVASVFGLIGAVIGSRIAAAAADRAAKAAERRHFRELGLQFALVNFQTCMEIAKNEAARHHVTVEVPPLKAFVIQGIRIMETVGDGSLTQAEMIRRISESEDFAKGISRAAQKK